MCSVLPCSQERSLDRMVVNWSPGSQPKLNPVSAPRCPSPFQRQISQRIVSSAPDEEVMASLHVAGKCTTTPTTSQHYHEVKDCLDSDSPTYVEIPFGDCPGDAQMSNGVQVEGTCDHTLPMKNICDSDQGVTKEPGGRVGRRRSRSLDAVPVYAVPRKNSTDRSLVHTPTVPEHESPASPPPLPPKRFDPHVEGLGIPFSAPNTAEKMIHKTDQGLCPSSKKEESVTPKETVAKKPAGLFKGKLPWFGRKMTSRRRSRSCEALSPLPQITAVVPSDNSSKAEDIGTFPLIKMDCSPPLSRRAFTCNQRQTAKKEDIPQKMSTKFELTEYSSSPMRRPDKQTSTVEKLKFELKEYSSSPLRLGCAGGDTPTEHPSPAVGFVRTKSVRRRSRSLEYIHTLHGSPVYLSSNLNADEFEHSSQGQSVQSDAEFSNKPFLMSNKELPVHVQNPSRHVQDISSMFCPGDLTEQCEDLSSAHCEVYEQVKSEAKNSLSCLVRKIQLLSGPDSQACEDEAECMEVEELQCSPKRIGQETENKTEMTDKSSEGLSQVKSMAPSPRDSGLPLAIPAEQHASDVQQDSCTSQKKEFVDFVPTEFKAAAASTSPLDVCNTTVTHLPEKASEDKSSEPVEDKAVKLPDAVLNPISFEETLKDETMCVGGENRAVETSQADSASSAETTGMIKQEISMTLSCSVTSGPQAQQSETVAHREVVQNPCCLNEVAFSSSVSMVSEMCRPLCPATPGRSWMQMSFRAGRLQRRRSRSVDETCLSRTITVLKNTQHKDTAHLLSAESSSLTKSAENTGLTSVVCTSSVAQSIPAQACKEHEDLPTETPAASECLQSPTHDPETHIFGSHEVSGVSAKRLTEKSIREHYLSTFTHGQVKVQEDQQVRSQTSHKLSSETVEKTQLQQEAVLEKTHPEKLQSAKGPAKVAEKLQPYAEKELPFVDGMQQSCQGIVHAVPVQLLETCQQPPATSKQPPPVMAKPALKRQPAPQLIQHQQSFPPEATPTLAEIKHKFGGTVRTARPPNRRRSRSVGDVSALASNDGDAPQTSEGGSFASVRAFWDRVRSGNSGTERPVMLQRKPSTMKRLQQQLGGKSVLREEKNESSRPDEQTAAPESPACSTPQASTAGKEDHVHAKQGKESSTTFVQQEHGGQITSENMGEITGKPHEKLPIQKSPYITVRRQSSRKLSRGSSHVGVSVQDYVSTGSSSSDHGHSRQTVQGTVGMLSPEAARRASHKDKPAGKTVKPDIGTNLKAAVQGFENKLSTASPAMETISGHSEAKVSAQHRFTSNKERKKPVVPPKTLPKPTIRHVASNQQSSPIRPEQETVQSQAVAVSTGQSPASLTTDLQVASRSRKRRSQEKDQTDVPEKIGGPVPRSASHNEKNPVDDAKSEPQNTGTPRCGTRGEKSQEDTLGNVRTVKRRSNDKTDSAGLFPAKCSNIDKKDGQTSAGVRRRSSRKLMQGNQFDKTDTSVLTGIQPKTDTLLSKRISKGEESKPRTTPRRQSSGKGTASRIRKSSGTVQRSGSGRRPQTIQKPTKEETTVQLSVSARHREGEKPLNHSKHCGSTRGEADTSRTPSSVKRLSSLKDDTQSSRAKRRSGVGSSNSASKRTSTGVGKSRRQSGKVNRTDGARDRGDTPSRAGSFRKQGVHPPQSPTFIRITRRLGVSDEDDSDAGIDEHTETSDTTLDNGQSCGVTDGQGRSRNIPVLTRNVHTRRSQRPDMASFTQLLEQTLNSSLKNMDGRGHSPATTAHKTVEKSAGDAGMETDIDSWTSDTRLDVERKIVCQTDKKVEKKTCSLSTMV